MKKTILFSILVLFFLPLSVWACEVSQIAIIPGSWTSDDSRISLKVQTQDDSGKECSVPADADTPLRISFFSGSGGVFTNQGGEDPIKRINRGNSNHHFYYKSDTLMEDVIIVSAGYGDPVTFLPLWEVVVEIKNIKEQTQEIKEKDSPQEKTDVISTHSSQVPLSQSVKVPELEVSAGRNRLVLVGVPVDFEAEITKGELQNRGDFEWSFGDGTADRGSTVSKSYDYPGEYVVVLNAENDKIKAIARTKVTVVPAEISLKLESDGVRLVNESRYEINVGGFSVVSENTKYVLPRDTIILSGSGLFLSPKILGFTVGSGVSLLSPGGDTVFEAGVAESQNLTLEELSKAQEELARLQSLLFSMTTPQSPPRVNTQVVTVSEVDNELEDEIISNSNMAETILVLNKEDPWISRLGKIPSRGLSLLRGSIGR